ncbi:MAG: glutamate racemase [Lentisphaeria bacterium]
MNRTAIQDSGGAGGPVVLFDSGVGGLTVLRAIRTRLPEEPLHYVADQTHVPYGGRPAAEVAGFAAGIARFALTLGARLLVVACNSASGAALRELRAAFPRLPIVGMEPAIKPAVALSRSGVVGVLATAATLGGQLYPALRQRVAAGVTVLEDPCEGLVACLERGDADGPETRAILRRVIAPMLARGADVLVLGCTHFPLALAVIRELAGPDVTVIDPAPAVASRVVQLLAAGGGRPAGAPGGITLYTSGDPAALARVAGRWLGLAAAPPVLGVRWVDGELRRA